MKENIVKESSIKDSSIEENCAEGHTVKSEYFIKLKAALTRKHERTNKYSLLAREVEPIRDHRYHPKLQQWKDTGGRHRKCTFLRPDILVVNDGSTDETAGILSRESNLHTITHPVNQGKGVALRHGLSFAKSKDFGMQSPLILTDSISLRIFPH
ncbi:glycosyltransferase [Bacteroides sp. CR5/BHMF/2]|nr:glycosyltransferase [Bacteroides sp. CR5/BHMF/2]